MPATPTPLFPSMSLFLTMLVLPCTISSTFPYFSSYKLAIGVLAKCRSLQEVWMLGAVQVLEEPPTTDQHSQCHLIAASDQKLPPLLCPPLGTCGCPNFLEPRVIWPPGVAHCQAPCFLAGHTCTRFGTLGQNKFFRFFSCAKWRDLFDCRSVITEIGQCFVFPSTIRFDNSSGN